MKLRLNVSEGAWVKEVSVVMFRGFQTLFRLVLGVVMVKLIPRVFIEFRRSGLVSDYYRGHSVSLQLCHVFEAITGSLHR